MYTDTILEYFLRMEKNMSKTQQNGQNYYTIDLGYIFKIILQKIWILVVVGVITAGIGFSLASFVIQPSYSASVKLYVNNGSTGNGISTTQITAAQELVNTYMEILHSNPTYELIIEEADLDYSVKQLAGMIESGASNNTEVMYVTVTANDPYVAADIANAAIDALVYRISDVIEDSSVKVVQTATPNTNKVSPNTTMYTSMGLFIGVFITAAIIAIAAITDNKIHDDEYITDTFDCPILARIPDFTEKTHSGKYAYYSKYKYRSSDNSNASSK